MPSCSRRTISAILQWTFSPTQSVNHMHAFPFQRPCPFDIALFIEPGLQLHQYGDLLSVFDGFEQGLHDGRVPPHAIQCHLDGQHVGVVRRLPQKIDHRLERFIGMMQQTVLLANYGEDVVRVSLARIPLESRVRRACRSAPAGPAKAVAADASNRAGRARRRLHPGSPRDSQSGFRECDPRWRCPPPAAPACENAAAIPLPPPTREDRRSRAP